MTPYYDSLHVVITNLYRLYKHHSSKDIDENLQIYPSSVSIVQRRKLSWQSRYLWRNLLDSMPVLFYGKHYVLFYR